MARALLKELNQGKFLGTIGYSHEGVCYYICEHVQEKVWCRPQAGSFKKAVDLAKAVIPATVIKAGKAKNLAQKGGRAKAQENYGTISTPLNINSVYRIGLWFGPNDEAPTSASHQNHEAMMITGAGAEIVFLEPNFGFYHGTADSVSGTNKELLEAEIKDLYQGINYHAENFHYQRIRGL